MDGEALRALQAPLKAKYREDAASARIPARAVAELSASDIACTIVGRSAPVVAGLHPAAGGDGTQACSADLLLEAVVACAGVTLWAVATAMGVAVRGGRVIAEGHWDARGTLGVDRAAPVGMTDITLRFEVECDADAEKLARMVGMTERYCVILQTLRNPPRIEVG